MQTLTTSYKPLTVFESKDLIPLHSDYLWLLQRGIVKTVTWHEQGNAITLGYWGVGDLVGLPLSLIQPYEIKCLTSVQAVRIPLHDCDSNSLVIVRYFQQMEQLLALARCDPLPQRLLAALSWLSNKFGHQILQGRRIDLRLTHQELASFVGASRASVTRLLNQFEQQEIISRLGKHIIVKTSDASFSKF